MSETDWTSMPDAGSVVADDTGRKWVVTAVVPAKHSVVLAAVPIVDDLPRDE